MKTPLSFNQKGTNLMRINHLFANRVLVNRVLVVGVFALAAATFSGCGNKSGTTSGSSGGATTTGTTSSDASFSSGDTLATVNGDVITRGDMYKLLSATGGEQILNALIRERIVMQQLKKSNLVISDAEVEEAIEAQKLTNPQQAVQIDEVIKNGGPKLEALRFQVRQVVAANKLLTKDVKVDETKLKAWFEKNKARYNVPENIKVGLLAASTKARVDAMAAQLKAKTKTFEQLVEDQKKANDPQAQSSTVTDGPTGSRAELVKLFGPILGPSLQKVPIGGNSPVVQAQKTPAAYVILGVVSGKPAQAADFVKMRDKIETDYKLEQIARQEVQKMGGKQPFEQVVKQYQTGLSQQNQGKPVSYNTVLAALTQGKVQEIQQDLTKNVDVKIDDPDLVKVGEQFKPAPTPTPAGSPGAAASASPASSPAAASPAASSPAASPAN